MIAGKGRNMRRRKPVTQRAMIQQKDLLRLGKEKLADLLVEQISNLPYHRQKQWVRSHLPDRIPMGRIQI